MDIIARGAYRVSSIVWQPRPGAFSLTLVCRAAFELAPGESPMVSLPHDEGADRIAEDAIAGAPLKRWPEVLVVGHAHAPEGKPVSSLVARVAVGDLDKTIQVQGDRSFTAEGHLLGPAPFTQMPIRWDRAAGGPGTWNPGGMVLGASAPVDDRGRLALPNFEPAGAHVATRDDIVPPVGLGPLPADSPMRTERLGRHAASWDAATWTARPLAEGFDFAYFNAAPHDQILSALAGDERIVLEHLHPRHARLTTYLRGVPPSASAGFGGAAHELTLSCDTLVIDADRGIAELVWRGQLAIDRPDREGMIMVIEDRAARASSKPHTATAVLSPASAPGGPSRRAGVSTTDVVYPPPPPSAASSLVQTLAPSAALRPAVPFQPRAHDAPPPSGPPAPPPPPPRSASVVMTMAPSPARPPRPLPFARTPVPAPRFGPPPEVPPAPLVTAMDTAPMAAPILASPPVEPLHVSPPPVEPLHISSPPVEPLHISPSPFSSPSVESRAISSLPVSSSPVSSSSVSPLPVSPLPAEAAPPEMIGPIPVSERAETNAVVADTTDDRWSIDAYPIERCARMAARLARRPEEQHAILEEEEIPDARWEEIHAHWLAEIKAEGKRGKKALRSAYDAAYVAEVEDERGAIDAATYARLVIAAERGTEDETLAEMGLPRDAMMPIRRVWLGRMVGDRAAAAGVRAAMRAAAEA